METLLTLTVGGLPPLCARGCEQVLKPITLGQMVRTINGELVHTGPSILKYQSLIQAKDKTVLACNGLYPGVIVRVGCIQPLWEKIVSPQKPHLLSREPVEGSLIVIDESQTALSFYYRDGHVILDEKPKTGSAYLCYRPYLTMRVTDFLIKTNEWTFESSWELNLEEI